jgi:putative intracellular protease/amidase
MNQAIVHLYILDTLADWEPGYAVAGINSPMLTAQPGHFTIKTVGASREPIRTAGGITMVPDMAVDELVPEGSTMLLLPGGTTWHQPEHQAVVEKAKAFLARGVPVAAICGATEALARAGVLDTRRHTSGAPQQVTLDGYHGAALYQFEAAVTDGDLITAGPTAPLEWAYHIFKHLGVNNDDVLDAWYGLFKTGEAAYYMRLQELGSA